MISKGSREDPESELQVLGYVNSTRSPSAHTLLPLTSAEAGFLKAVRKSSAAKSNRESEYLPLIIGGWLQFQRIMRVP